MLDEVSDPHVPAALSSVPIVQVTGCLVKYLPGLCDRVSTLRVLGHVVSVDVPNDTDCPHTLHLSVKYKRLAGEPQQFPA